MIVRGPRMKVTVSLDAPGYARGRADGGCGQGKLGRSSAAPLQVACRVAREAKLLQRKEL
jgi:hypothetical protein